MHSPGEPLLASVVLSGRGQRHYRIGLVLDPIAGSEKEKILHQN